MKTNNIILCISILTVVCVLLVVFIRLPEIIIVDTKDSVFLVSWYVLVLSTTAGSLVRLHEYWTQNLKLYSFIISENEERRNETTANRQELRENKNDIRTNRKLIDNNTTKINKIIDSGGNQR